MNGATYYFQSKHEEGQPLSTTISPQSGIFKYGMIDIVALYFFFPPSFSRCAVLFAIAFFFFASDFPVGPGLYCHTLYACFYFLFFLFCPCVFAPLTSSPVLLTRRRLLYLRSFDIIGHKMIATVPFPDTSPLPLYVCVFFACVPFCHGNFSMPQHALVTQPAPLSSPQR